MIHTYYVCMSTTEKNRFFMYTPSSHHQKFKNSPSTYVLCNTPASESCSLLIGDHCHEHIFYLCMFQLSLELDDDSNKAEGESLATNCIVKRTTYSGISNIPLYCNPVAFQVACAPLANTCFESSVSTDLPRQYLQYTVQLCPERP